MPKYECRTCTNTFVQASSANRQCPACGSNNIYEVYEQPASQGAIYDYRGIIISGVIILLMLVALFLLPYYPIKYLVSLQKQPEACALNVNVTVYGEQVDSAKFEYSFDNGKTFQKGRQKAAIVPVQYNVKVKKAEESKDTIIYGFNNPQVYKPAAACVPVPVDPCDCKGLRVVEVVKTKVDNRDALIVQALPAGCGVEYSISGINGPYQSDSIFRKFQPVDSVFVRTSKCVAVGYYRNPFVAVQPVAKPDPKPRPPASSGKKVFAEDDVDEKPYPYISKERSELIQHIKDQINGLGTHGEISFSFVVETLGNTSSFEFTSAGVSQEFSRKIISVINALGNWTPGYKNGDPVNTRIKVRIPAN